MAMPAVPLIPKISPPSDQCSLPIACVRKIPPCLQRNTLPRLADCPGRHVEARSPPGGGQRGSLGRSVWRRAPSVNIALSCRCFDGARRNGGWTQQRLIGIRLGDSSENSRHLTVTCSINVGNPQGQSRSWLKNVPKLITCDLSLSCSSEPATLKLLGGETPDRRRSVVRASCVDRLMILPILTGCRCTV